MKRMRIACLMLCLLLLTSCTSTSSVLPAATLPPVAAGPEAPVGDAGLQREVIVPLHLPSADGQSLLTFFETLSLSRDQHPALMILLSLLNHPGNDRVRPLSETGTLALSGANPVEISGGVCTVNLSASAYQLSAQALHTAALAITETLCELDDITHVNLLIAGTPVGMDVGGNLPLGTLSSSPGAELPSLWAQFFARRTPAGELPAHTPLTAAATLYFPLADGSGIISEPRRLSFPGQHPQHQVLTLLSALSAGAELIQGTAELPDLNSLLLFAPEITVLDSGGRRATLHFISDVEKHIVESGCDPASVFAAITTTLTAFVPSLQQVCILVGDGALTSLYSAKLGSLQFPGAIHTRQAYAHTLLTQTTIYLPGEDGLTPCHLALPYRSAVNPRALLIAMADPAVGALPEGLSDAELLGLSVQDGTLLINFSARYGRIIRASGADQRLTAYSIVNTLCEMLGVRRVRFYFGGEALENLGSSLAWNGEFLYNPALISH